MLFIILLYITYISHVHFFSSFFIQITNTQESSEQKPVLLYEVCVCVCMYKKGTLHIISMSMCVWIYSDETHLFFFTEIIFWMHFIGISNTNLITFDKITAILTLFNLKYLIYLDDSGSSDPIFRRPVNNGATVESHYTIFVHFAFCMLLIA